MAFCDDVMSIGEDICRQSHVTRHNCYFLLKKYYISYVSDSLTPSFFGPNGRPYEFDDLTLNYRLPSYLSHNFFTKKSHLVRKRWKAYIWDNTSSNKKMWY